MAGIKGIPVKEKLAVLSRLWKSNVKAETLYVEDVNVKKQMDYALSNEIPMILFIG